MGKKFAGANQKAVAARERKGEQKRQKEEQRAKSIEDAKWVDNDPKALKQEQKRLESEQKRQEALKRKAELKALEAKEQEQLAKISGKGKGATKARNEPAVPKVTRAQLEKMREEEEKRRKAEEEQQRQLASGVVPAEQHAPLEVNINQVLAEERAKHGEQWVEARTLEDAVQQMTLAVPSASADGAKAEKRMTYTAYEAVHLPRMRGENPTLKLNQVKELVWKSWLRSPDNPQNRPGQSKK